MAKASGGKQPGGERGAAEENSGVPLTPAERHANERPPGNPEGHERDSRAEGFAEANIGNPDEAGRSDRQ